MNKRELFLVIIAVSAVVLVAGSYGCYYAYATMVLVPEDLNTLKSELNSINNSVIIPESDIQKVDTLADQFESGELVLVSDSQRKTVADSMRSDPSFYNLDSTMQQVKKNFTVNREIASRYDFILKEDVANDIRSIYSDDYLQTAENICRIYQKMPEDFENGDKNVIIADFRNYTANARKLNNQTAQAKVKLEDVILKLES
ncbi:MAG: hypothetical protein ACC609_11150 [Methanobacterium formicicum]